MPDRVIFENSANGIFALHPEPDDFVALVGPATTDQLNTIRPRLVAVACAQLPDRHFAFDSSFVTRAAAAALKRLGGLLRLHPGSPVSIFGHADPVGADDYNKNLSGRRARAVFGLLTRDISFWEDLFSNPFGNDIWGDQAIQSMLAALTFEAIRRDGTADDNAKGAIKKFQQDNGLAVDGIAGRQTREKLFSAYMDFLYGKDFTKMDPKKHFLGRGADKGGKADYQGCGEFNPVLMFSKQEQEDFQNTTDKTARNKANEPNRRVLVFLFTPGSQVAPDHWPCPRVKEGVDGCKKRFFSNASKRREFQEQARKFEKTHDTFACRFYDRIAFNSPCERVRLPLSRLRVRLFDPFARPLAGAPCKIFGDGKEIFAGSTNPNGFVETDDVDLPVTCQVKWELPDARRVKSRTGSDLPASDDEFPYTLDVFVTFEGQDDTSAARMRLSNLGYRFGDTMSDDIKAFQRDQGLAETGKVEDVRDKLAIVHDTFEPAPQPLPKPFSMTSNHEP